MDDKTYKKLKNRQMLIHNLLGIGAFGIPFCFIILLTNIFHFNVDGLIISTILLVISITLFTIGIKIEDHFNK